MSRFTERGSVGDRVRVDGVCDDMVRVEVRHWFFDEFVPTWVRVGSSAIARGPEFILDYWDAPLHISTPTSQEWLRDNDAIIG